MREEPNLYHLERVFALQQVARNADFETFKEYFESKEWLPFDYGSVVTCGLIDDMYGSGTVDNLPELYQKMRSEEG